MAKRRDPHTRDLFASPEPVSVGFGEDVLGRGTLSAQIARVVSRTLSDAREDFGLTRVQIAALMAEQLGRDVSDETLNKWASEASDDRRIPLDAFVALIAATKGYDALGWIPQLFGYAVVENRYVEIIELKQIEDHQRVLNARRVTLEAKLRARS